MKITGVGVSGLGLISREWGVDSIRFYWAFLSAIVRVESRFLLKHKVDR